MTFCLIQYRYDPLDRLVTCALANESPSQRFYQHLRLATEVQGDGSNSVFQYADQLLAQRTNASTQLLATDSQRSVLSADQHTRQGYSPYGQRSIFSGVGSLLGFNGERPDPLTEHYLLGNGYRAYNPVLMRFNSPDSVSPFGEGGINAYAYCSGDPLNWKDPTGHVRLPRKLLGVVGATVATSPVESSSFVSQVVDMAKKSLTRSSSSPELMPTNRQLLNEGLERMPRNQSFTKLLDQTNQNLSSHSDTNLSKSHALFYLNTAKTVESGELSNTGAHFRAAYHWLSKTNGPSRPVGTVFNAAAAFMSGGIDHGLRKTGRGLLSRNSLIRDKR